MKCMVMSENSFSYRLLGFIASAIVAQLLERGYKVIGIDDYSKYGEINAAMTAILILHSIVLI